MQSQDSKKQSRRAGRDPGDYLMHSPYFMMRKLRTHKVILYIQDILVNKRAEFKLGSNTPKASTFPLYHLV